MYEKKENYELHIVTLKILSKPTSDPFVFLSVYLIESKLFYRNSVIIIKKLCTTNYPPEHFIQ